MNTPTHTDERLTALEIKTSFQEEALEHLNAVVVRQQQDIARLQLALAELKHLQGQDAGQADALRSLRDELPPHY